MLRCLAPAKINLVLEVLGKRDDGYHEIRSLVQTISLCDVLEFELADGIFLECDEPSLETSDNLVIKAAELLREISGLHKGARIKLEKRIPWSAGLGGGSSDAAATLLALNKLWDLKLEASNLAQMAAKLGSDVPFFIYGGAALMEGRGEKVTPLMTSPPAWFVLLVPPLPREPDKTRWLFALLSRSNFTDGKYTDEAMRRWSQKKPLDSTMFFNVFDRVAFGAFPGLVDYWRRFQEIGAKDIHLTGSGPALFARVPDKSGAKRICGQVKQEGLEAYAVSSVMPQV